MKWWPRACQLSSFAPKHGSGPTAWYHVDHLSRGPRKDGGDWGPGLSSAPLPRPPAPVADWNGFVQLRRSSSGRTTWSPNDYRRRRGTISWIPSERTGCGGGLGLALAPSTLAVLAFCNSEFDAHFERVWSFFCRELCSLFFPLLVRGSKPASAREP